MANTRNSSGLLLPPEVSAQIWSDAQAASVVMSKASRINLPGEGVDVPLITGDPTASWIGEAEKIAVGESTFGSKSIRPRKVALIELFSNEFKRDLPALYAELATRLPKTIAKAYDSKVFHSAAEANAFDSLAGAQALSLGVAGDPEDVYSELVDIDSAVYEANGTPDGYVFAPKARRTLLNARDADGRPLLLNSLTESRSVPTLLGVDVEYAAAAYKAGVTGTPETLGYVGQWAGNAFYGVVQDIRVEISTEATIDTGGAEPISLFQNDMFALRVIAHLGFAVRDLTKFVKVTGETPA